MKLWVIKISCTSTIIQLNCSIGYDTKHFISEGNSSMIYKSYIKISTVKKIQCYAK